MPQTFCQILIIGRQHGILPRRSAVNADELLVVLGVFPPQAQTDGLFADGIGRQKIEVTELVGQHGLCLGLQFRGLKQAHEGQQQEGDGRQALLSIDDDIFGFRSTRGALQDHTSEEMACRALPVDTQQIFEQLFALCAFPAIPTLIDRDEEQAFGLAMNCNSFVALPFIWWAPFT